MGYSRRQAAITKAQWSRCPFPLPSNYHNIPFPFTLTLSPLLRPLRLSFPLLFTAHMYKRTGNIGISVTSSVSSLVFDSLYTVNANSHRNSCTRVRRHRTPRSHTAIAISRERGEGERGEQTTAAIIHISPVGNTAVHFFHCSGR